MPGPTLMVDLAPPELDEARRREFAADLARRLAKTGRFVVQDVREEPPGGRRSGFEEVDRVAVAWAEEPEPGLNFDAAVPLGERVAGALVETIRPWLVDAAPHVTRVVVRLDDVTLAIDANGASGTETVALARAYAHAVQSVGS
jgi:hypothetical protein